MSKIPLALDVHRVKAQKELKGKKSTVPIPSVAQVVAAMADKVAKDVKKHGSAAAKSVYSKETLPPKDAKRVEEAVQIVECQLLVDKLNKYRKNLKDKIDFPFKKKYTPIGLALGGIGDKIISEVNWVIKV